MLNNMPLPQLKLNTVIPQGIVYTPMNFTPQELPNVNILAQSFAQNEARQKEAAEKRSALDLALADIEKQLNPAEKDWFNNYKNDIKSQVQLYSTAGDYTGAINYALNAATKAASDPAIINRIQYQKDYQDWLETLRQNKNIDDNTREYLRWANPYAYQDIKNNNGEVISGTTFNKDFQVFDDMDWTALGYKAAQMIQEQGGTTQYGSVTPSNFNTQYPKKNAKGQLINKDYYNVHSDDISHWIASNSGSGKDVARIAAVFNSLLEDPATRAQVMQDFNKRQFMIQNALNKRNNAVEGSDDYINYNQQYEQLLNDVTLNGVPVTNYNEYYEAMIKKNYPALFAYRNTTRTYDETVKGTGNGRGTGIAPSPFLEGRRTGVRVLIKGTETASQSYEAGVNVQAVRNNDNDTIF